jgi:hypothetical protein
MPTNPWLQHLAAFYAKNKHKMTYTEAMSAAKATYKKPKKAQKGAGFMDNPLGVDNKKFVRQRTATGVETNYLVRR